ncbi:RcpC/CpaB family pilus assembly protein, partial [Streptomyces sp. SM1]|uniref:RcpC/CpaB family pilus assembly protein n=2 Tax=unclassified Streptomyces TaxID=2593676 RepID=UPI000CD5495D
GSGLRTASASPGDRPVRPRGAGKTVLAPVRIADAATVRLLRPGDLVDVIAAEETMSGGEARVVARGARVTEVPEPVDGADDGGKDDGGTGDSGTGDSGTGDGGALVVLSVPRATAAGLAGASATARLAVTLC